MLDGLRELRVYVADGANAAVFPRTTANSDNPAAAVACSCMSAACSGVSFTSRRSRTHHQRLYPLIPPPHAAAYLKTLIIAPQPDSAFVFLP